MNNPVNKQVGRYKGSSVTHVATSNLACPLCKANHQLYHCQEFLKLMVEERIKVAKKAHLCINCLRSTAHHAKVCNSGACRKCSKKHNSLLHISTSDNSYQSSSALKASSENSNDPPLPVATQCVSSHRSLSILLSTAIVNI